jgi:enamine deaminase RidA (YjgF/YER057c/UK114 family)
VRCAGQASVDAEGHPVHAGDIVAQTRQALDNLDTVLAAADMTLGEVVRLTYYTTDVDTFVRDALGPLVRRLRAERCRPASTLLGVDRLAHPALMIEIEATAVA